MRCRRIFHICKQDRNVYYICRMFRMKMTGISRFAAVLGLLALVAVSCAKTEKTSTYDSAKRFVEAWMNVNHPGVLPTEDGIYMLEDMEGDGVLADTLSYLYVNYTVRTIKGIYDKTNSVDIAQQLGSYDKTAFYGPHIWRFDIGSQYAGVIDMVKGMKVGGKKTALIPRWLISLQDFDTEEEYLSSSKGGTEDFIYSIEIVDGTDDVLEWQEDSIDRFVARNFEEDMLIVDTVGFRYICLKEPKDSVSFPVDTTVYINYTGRLLNGQIFDTNVEKTAKDAGIYNASRSYGALPVSWGETYSDLTLDGSSVVSGFSRTLWEMGKYEKGIGIFYSEFGYSASGSGSTIPEYSPLMFEIEIVDKPEDD